LIVLLKIKSAFLYLLELAIKYWQITLAFIAGIIGFIAGIRRIKPNDSEMLEEELGILKETQHAHEENVKEIVEAHHDEQSKLTEKYLKDKKEIEEQKQKKEKDLKADHDKIDKILQNKFKLKKGK
jgi:hypothetical protein